MSDHEMISHHLARTGANKAAHTDPAAQLQVSILRDFVAVLHSALNDEGVDPETARRVIRHVLYGCAPQPHEAEQRIMERESATEALAGANFVWTVPGEE